MITYPTNKLQKVLLSGGCEQNGTPTPDAPMDIVSNNGALKARHQPGLPLGYTLLDYIESTGTQYINTGAQYTSSTQTAKYDLDFQMVNFNSAGGGLWGVLLQHRSGCLWFKPSDGNYAFAASISNTPSAASSINIPSDKNRHHVIFDAGLTSQNNTVNINYDGTSYNDTYTYSYNNLGIGTDIYLFCSYDLISYTPIAMKVYSFKIYLDNTLVRNFVPAQTVINGETVNGMYDTVTGTFFTNQGTGDFVAGSAVSGTVETIQATGKNLYNKENGVLFGYPTLDYTWYQQTDSSRELTIMVRLKEGSTYTATRAEDSNSEFRIQASATPTLTQDQSLVDISSTGAATITTKTFTVPQGAPYVLFYVRNTEGRSPLTVDDVINAFQVELGSTATEYQPYYDGGTAVAEMLLKVGDYQDVQEVLSGAITRNVGVKVLDGTEMWTMSGNLFYVDIATDALEDTHSCYCTHFKGLATNASASYDNEIKVGTNSTQYISWKRVQIYPTVGTFSNVSAFQNWLAAQYAAGTPVIIVYPLITPTTEQVTPQPLTGNTVTQTAGSIDNLPIEISTISELKKRYIGDNEVKRVYIGDNLVWEND